MGFSPHTLYQGICPGFPDVHCLTDGWMEQTMHRQVQ